MPAYQLNACWTFKGIKDIWCLLSSLAFTEKSWFRTQAGGFKEVLVFTNPSRYTWKAYEFTKSVNRSTGTTVCPYLLYMHQAPCCTTFDEFVWFTKEGGSGAGYKMEQLNFNVVYRNTLKHKTTSYRLFSFSTLFRRGISSG